MPGMRLARRSLAASGVFLALAIVLMTIDVFFAIREARGVGYVLWFLFGAAFCAAGISACAAIVTLIREPALRSGKSYILLMAAMVLAALLSKVVFDPTIE